MILERLAADLDEIRRKTEALAVEVGSALAILTEEGPDDAARRQACAIITAAVEGQEALEFRCQDLALIVRQLALLPDNTPAEVYEGIWNTFSSPALAGAKSRRLPE